MKPEEWPIAAPVGEAASLALAAGGDRLRTVRLDFFLPPRERLSEQERALMTAMLGCLVEEIAVTLRAAQSNRAIVAHADDAALIDRLTRCGLLNRDGLVALLLQRAEEERIGSAARSRSGRREARTLQGLVSHASPEVSAAAMGLILARGRRRNRFGQCLLAFDDLPSHTAEDLANAVAAGLTIESSDENSAASFSAAATELSARHDRMKGSDSLMQALVGALADVGALDDDLVLAWAQEGEVGLIAAAVATRGRIPLGTATEEMLSCDGSRIARLMRVGGFSRALAAGILASVGDLLGIEDVGEAIGSFDSLDDAALGTARSWLAASPQYRAALSALGARRG